jgi:hypothetical protein
MKETTNTGDIGQRVLKKYVHRIKRNLIVDPMFIFHTFCRRSAGYEIIQFITLHSPLDVPYENCVSGADMLIFVLLIL